MPLPSARTVAERSPGNISQPIRRWGLVRSSSALKAWYWNCLGAESNGRSTLDPGAGEVSTPRRFIIALYMRSRRARSSLIPFTKGAMFKPCSGERPDRMHQKAHASGGIGSSPSFLKQASCSPRSTDPFLSASAKWKRASAFWLSRASVLNQALNWSSRFSGRTAVENRPYFAARSAMLTSEYTCTPKPALRSATAKASIGS
mmetsp:Transcript_70989/g.220289  ORF Transcript_70989/g.220289 Transcript_70989/m.220289 type:complete len:203 (-) Transcript_70989:261-869(-)